jgi:hypothetical protein
MSLLTLFTAPKPFTNPHIALIQRNALRSWLALGEDVQVIVIGEEEGLGEIARELNVLHLPQVARNESGTPLVSSIFDLARQNSNSPLLAYVNADIILLPDLVTAARQVMEQRKEFLMVGQRWDLRQETELDTAEGWDEHLLTQLKTTGRRHPRGGSDYFLYPRACFELIPAFAIGRAGWDNWMIYEARQQGWPVVDTSSAVNIVHQDHDYSHLPNGQSHYRLPETKMNVLLAGGDRTIFTLEDADCVLENGKIRPFPVNGKKFWREVETFPLRKMHSFSLGQLFYAIFHPQRAYREWRTWLRKQKTNQSKVKSA